MRPRAELEILRQLLCQLGDCIRERLVSARGRAASEDFAQVAAVTAADTIYRIDRISEETILEWFAANWPASMPVEVVMEGLEDREPPTFPQGTPVAQTRWKVIIDPIDGTRCIMHDKRAAWALAGVAPQRGPDTALCDIVVAVMTELPTSKQWRADQLSAIRGGGPDGVVLEAIHVLTGARSRLPVRRSEARDLNHGFASFVKFFVEGKAATAAVEEALWRELTGDAAAAKPSLVFDDQYLSTGGQLHELITGRDRFVADLRPLVFAHLGLRSALTCHPYDICTALILEEAGGVIESPEGGALRAPLDTTSAVAWVGYANGHLAEWIRPSLLRVLREQGMVAQVRRD